MLIAITGGSGFIGKRLIQKHLQQGDKVRFLSRKNHQDFISKNIEFFHLDLVQATVEELNYFLHGVDIFYHCAGEINDESKMYSLHIEGTKKLLVAAKNVKRWVQLSSVGVYGKFQNGNINETTVCNPVGIYESSKLESDRLVCVAGENKDIEFTILRPSNVFAFDMPNQSIFQLIKMVDNNLFFFIGKSGARANYIHADNVVFALMLCVQHSKAINQIYNISDSLYLEDFIAMICDYLGKKTITHRIPEELVKIITNCCEKIPYFPLTTSRISALTNHSQYSIDKISDELGYKPIIPLKQGLQEMVKTYQQQKKHFDK